MSHHGCSGLNHDPARLPVMSYYHFLLLFLENFLYRGHTKKKKKKKNGRRRTISSIHQEKARIREDIELVSS